MEPEPQDPESKADENKKNSFDLDAILLPKKETPGQTPQSAQRVNAGILLEQEQNATLKQPEAAANPLLQRSSAAPRPIVKEDLPPTPPNPESSETASLQTYQGDIERLVQQKNISVVNIAAAEAVKRSFDLSKSAADTAAQPAPQPSASPVGRIALVIAGLLFILMSLGVLTYLFLRPTASVQVQTTASSPFITIDDTKFASFTQAQFTRANILASLTAARNNLQISLGLMSQFYIGISSSTNPHAPITGVTSQTLLTTLSPNIDQKFVRSLSGTDYLLGVHSYDGNQPFFIFKVDSYEQAFSGMLAWETTIQNDLAPLFTRTPRPHIKEEGIATSTLATTTEQIVQTGFVDRIVENRDARVIQNESGDILLLWTFLDRNTLVITTNEYTLREIISRVTNPPIVPLPQ